MRILICVAALAAFSTAALAQDKVTLTNGDVITGKITSMAEGKVTIASPLLADVVVKITDVSDIVTGETVTLKTKDGDLLPRRIIGMEGGNLRLEGATNSVAVDNLDMINPPEKAAPKWTGSLKTTALWTSGNTSRKAIGLLFDAVRATDADRITVDALWDYGEDKDVRQTVNGGANANLYNRSLTQRRAGAGIKYDLFLSKKTYLLATTRALGDTLADLKLRWTAGLGLGRTMVDDGTTLFLIEAGLSYFSEDYRTPGLESQDSLVARVAYRLEHQLSEQTRLVHRVEAYPSLEYGNDFYMQAWTEVSTSLTESMVASIAHTLNYDNTPAPGFQRADNRVLLTVGWTF
ncbi:MAG: DUF481 domain-containing protein [Planctomycetota bacterium]